MNNKILVVAPHPDDETLGIGGTLLKYQTQGDQIYWLIMTTIDSHSGYTKIFQAKRSEQIKKVAELYQMHHVFHLPFFAAELDRHPIGEIITAVQTVIKTVEPNIIYLPFLYDAHSDHRIAFEAAFTCTKIFRHPYITEILVYETLSETNFSNPLNPVFNPNVFVDISSTFEKKVEILKQYKGELQEHPFPRSIESIRSLAKLRGTQSDAIFSEAFMLLKRKW